MWNSKPKKLSSLKTALESNVTMLQNLLYKFMNSIEPCKTDYYLQYQMFHFEIGVDLFFGPSLVKMLRSSCGFCSCEFAWNSYSNCSGESGVLLLLCQFHKFILLSVILESFRNFQLADNGLRLTISQYFDGNGLTCFKLLDSDFGMR